MKRNKQDRLIADLIKRAVPPAAESPWFTRKVLNRLPAKHGRAFSGIEIVAYLLSAVVLVVVSVLESAHIGTTGVVTVGSIITYLGVVGCTVAIVVGVIRAWVSTDSAI